MLRVVFLDFVRRRHCLRGGQFLQIRARQDLALGGFYRPHDVGRAVELFLDRLLLGELLIDEPVDDFAFDAWRELRRHIGIARENVVDLMDRDFLGVHFGGNLRCRLLAVFLSTPGERRDAGRKQAKKWISHQPHHPVGATECKPDCMRGYARMHASYKQNPAETGSVWQLPSDYAAAFSDFLRRRAMKPSKPRPAISIE